MAANRFTVFTKPWKDVSLEGLCELVAGMGFDGMEYPIRDGYQVTPGDGAEGIKRLASVTASFGLTVGSIASDIADKNGRINEALFAGCGEAGVGIIRICEYLYKSAGFFENAERIRRIYDAAVPYCEKYGVTVGVQIHCNSFISSSAEAYILLKDYDPKHFAVVWDSGHSGLTGAMPCFAIDTVWDMLCMVNFKAAYWKRTSGPEAGEAAWESYWTTARNACGSWREAVEHLKTRGYTGLVCMPAEYTDEKNAEAYTRQDLAYLKGLFE